jgi:hypothetical protein
VVRLLDVNAHLGPLRSAAMPPLECVHCKTPMVAQVSETMTTMLRRLPKPELTPSRESFVKKAKKLPAKRLQNVLSPKPQRNAVPFLLRVSFITLGVAIAILVTEAVIAHRVYKHQTGVAGVVPGSQTDARPRYERPAWIIGGTGTAYCHDLINRFTCVGSSFYNPNRDDALGEATNAAMDELATAIGLKIDDPRFQEHTLAHYQAERSKALIAVDADVEPGNADYQQAREQVLDARERVANALKASGGTAIPAQRTDWYWEEYEADAPGTTEFLVFVRYDIGLDAIRALVSRYTLPVDVLGSSAVSAFPELAWRLKGFDGGVMIHQARGALAATGLRPGQIVTKVGGEPVHDPAALAQRLKKVGVGERVALTVLNISGATTSVEFEGK